jgi:outer membrane protein OmpA-like peptidoglycan-associated protein
VLVDRARGMGKVITIPFTSGKIAIGPGETAALSEKIKLPQLKKFSDDPTVVFVVLGYADKKGDQQKNLALSLERADSVVAALKQRCGVMNVVHSVGMGSSEIFDAQNLDKNRVVEVWAVLP